MSKVHKDDYYDNIAHNIREIEKVYGIIVDELKNEYTELRGRGHGSKYLRRIFNDVPRGTWSRLKSKKNKQGNAVNPTEKMQSQINRMDELRFIFEGDKKIEKLDAEELEDKIKEVKREFSLNIRKELIKTIKSNEKAKDEKWTAIVTMDKMERDNWETYDVLIRFLMAALLMELNIERNGSDNEKVMNVIRALTALEDGNIKKCSKEELEKLHKLINDKCKKVNAVKTYKSMR